MDDPNNDSRSSGHQGGDGSRRNLVYAERFKERLESISQEAQILSEITKPYREEARQQISRAIPEGNWPAYMAISGVTRDKIITHGEGLVSALAATNNTSLEDSQVQAVADSLMANARTTSMSQWGMFSGTLYMAYRNRHSMPLRLAASKGRLFKYVWPGVLFLVYSIPVSLFLSPIVTAAGARYHAGHFRNDPRLSSLSLDLSENLHRRLQSAQQSAQGQVPNQRQVPSQRYGERSQDNSDTPSQGYEGIRQPASPGWMLAKNIQSPPSPTTSGWGVSDDEDDDASPIASSARRSPPDSGLSKWEQLRIQSGSQQRPTPSRPPQESNGWGSTQSSDSGDDDRARSQAQQEFDALLEKERQGTGEGRAWGRK
ncbi:unnamed protein product [Clonostachys byssicola]|uniref:Uncharacterized protein n=1 Tax=Clonostachys byssicola TaxID=160290 RepID=A0A9N9Y896_9HYPO|nr:unnamed protein product [Clonostachys byssicola]